MFELVRCFKSIRAYGSDCFRFQGCSGVLIVIEFEFNFKWGFLVIGRMGARRVVPKWMWKDRHQGGGAQVDILWFIHFIFSKLV